MVHLYRNNGYNIALDVDSGSVHVIDDLVYELISLLKQDRSVPDDVITEHFSGRYTADEIGEALGEVRTLEKNGQLFAQDIYHGAVLDFRKRQTVVKALCLHIAHDCNLACEYCFAEEGEYHGRRALMSFEVGKKALDFLVANSGNRRNLEVDFFGGEPLMNFRVVQDLVAYGRKLEKENDKHFRFTLNEFGFAFSKNLFVSWQDDKQVIFPYTLWLFKKGGIAICTQLLILEMGITIRLRYLDIMKIILLDLEATRSTILCSMRRRKSL